MPTQEEAFAQPPISEVQDGTVAPRKSAIRRIGQRGILPFATKFRLIEFYDPTDNSVKFYTTAGVLFLTLNLTTGAVTFGEDVTFEDVMIFEETVTFEKEATFEDNLKYYSLEESGYGSEQTTGGTPSASTAEGSPEDAAAAFDNDFSSKWVAVGDNTPWLRYQFTAAKTITKYILTTGNDAPDRGPKSWQFQGSNNGTDWTTIETRTNEALVGIGVKYTFYVTNTTAYTYYRINITANNGSADSQLAEFEMFEDA